MEKERGKIDLIENLLPSKILRRNMGSGGGAHKHQRPKNSDFLLLAATEDDSESLRKKKGSSAGTTSGLLRSCQSNKTANPLEASGADLKWDQFIGYPVCIGGMKEGILRYYGNAKFAEGVWCGVELQEPVGKNDGTVNGVRYFYCKPDHGIFAPVGKISLLQPDDEVVEQRNFFRRSSEGPENQQQQQKSRLVGFLKQSSSDSTIQKRAKGSFVSYVDERNSRDERYFTDQRAPNFSSSSVSRSPRRSFEAARNSPSSRGAPFDSFGLDEPPINIPRKVMSEYSLQSQARRTFEPETITRLSPRLAFAKDPSLSPVNRDDDPEAFRASRQQQQLQFKSFVPSSFLDFQDDNEDDQLSMDYDESLGILTPSEMKDFTLCADFPTSCSDTRALDFPSSESFDEVNDLPEDEQVHDVSVQYLPSGVHHPHSVAVRQTDVAALSNGACYREDYQNVAARRAAAEKVLVGTSSNGGPSCDIETGFLSSLKQHLSTFEAKQSEKHSPVVCFNTETKINVFDAERKDTLEKRSDEQPTYHRNTVASLRCSGPLPNLEVETTLQGSGKLVSKQRFEFDIKTKKSYETDCGSRDSLLQNDLEQMTFKEKLTVSWEDCVRSSSPEEMFLKIERPESVYTVGSNDTGYQEEEEDGEFEADVVAMTTSAESNEGNKRFSTVSRDSGAVDEELDGDKVGESNSTSGYSTGLSDSYCNEKRQLEDSFHDVADSCTSDEVLAIGRDTERETSSLEKSEGFFDMVEGSARDSDSHSNFHITESVTVLGLDSTCDTLSDTVAADTTVIEVGTGTGRKGNRGEDSQPTMLESIPNTTTRSVGVSKTIVSQSNSSERQRQSGKPKEEEEDRRPELKSPKRNVMSKLKAVIGGSRSKSSDNSDSPRSRNPTTPKKSRWEAVTAKIAASLAEEKTKPKTKREASSRVDTNLTNTRQICRSPKLDLSSASDGKGDNSVASSTSSRSRHAAENPSRHRQQEQYPVAKSRDFGPSAHAVGMERKSEKEPRHMQRLLSLMAGCAPVCRMAYVIHTPPGPSKTCSSSRSASPVAASESSTSVSVASHQSRSKIAVWKGSNSTVASSTALVNARTPVPGSLPLADTSSSILRRQNNNSFDQTNRTANKATAVSKLRVGASSASSPMSPLSHKLMEPPNRPPRVAASKSRTAREQQQQGSTSSRPLVAPRPVRPPMWLSKAELGHEIQHLSTLCETRTKELNKLRLETRHVSAGFEALAVVIRYMSAELDAFKVPGLMTDLKLAEEKIQKGRTDLVFYEKEIQRVNGLHMKEVNKISHQLSEEYDSKFREMTEKHKKDVELVREEQVKEITCLNAALQASCDEEKQQHLKMLDDLQQELRKQREEMEIFHQHELDDLEELHLGKQRSLLAEIEKLQKQCAEAKQLSLTVEEALQKDTDTKLQWLSAKKTDLQNEVDSLKAVLEIKNNELHALRKENLEMQKELEDLPLAKEKIKMLQARAEDLQALVAEKVKHERQLSSEHQFMKETYEKETKVNMRLSMENEELLWRLRQASECSSILSATLPDECCDVTGDVSVEENLNSSVGCPLTLSEEPSPPPSPAKSAPPKFFTYMNQEELNALSPQSPRTAYKRIQPHKSPQATRHVVPASPKSSQSPARRGTDSEGSTPRKLARHHHRHHHHHHHQNRSFVDEEEAEHRRRGPVARGEGSPDERVENECFGRPVTTSDSVVEGACDVPSQQDETSPDDAVVDPKSFYQMAFPVGGEAAQDSEESPKEGEEPSLPLV